MPYPFFLSYARRDSFIGGDPQRRDPHFETFVERLNIRVNHYTGSQGFVDRTNIQPGQDWPDELAEALRTAHTMVCLYSPTYFLSEYCGKEMQILLDRRRRYIRNNAGKKPANIIPVLWHPVPGRIPLTLPEIQYKAPNLDPQVHGAWNLGDMGRNKDLEEFTDQIAQRVRDAADETLLPELDYIPRMVAVPSAFIPRLPLPAYDSPEAVAGPDAVTFVYASSTGWDTWPWAPPNEKAVLHVSAAVAKGKEMEPNQLVFDSEDPNLIQRLNAALQKNNVLIFLVDATSLANEGLCARMREYDRQKYSRFATMIIWRNNNRTTDLTRRMKETFEYFVQRAVPFFHEIDNREQFAKVVAQAIETLRIATVNHPHDPKRIGAATEFTSLPSVSGPGQVGTV